MAYFQHSSQTSRLLELSFHLIVPEMAMRHFRRDYEKAFHAVCSVRSHEHYRHEFRSSKVLTSTADGARHRYRRSGTGVRAFAEVPTVDQYSPRREDHALNRIGGGR